MKQWMQKLVSQLDLGWGDKDNPTDGVAPTLSEDRATIVYVIDVINKHLLEFDDHPVRKVREVLDNFAKELLSSNPQNIERTLFRFRQFYSGYRIDEYTYVQKSFEDFKGIIWDFVDQLAEDIRFQQSEENEVYKNLELLKEAVESNSIVTLKNKAREFVDFYSEYHAKRDTRRMKRMQSIRKNLDQVKKKLVEANHTMRTDHLTEAFNRKSFDEHIELHWRLFNATPDSNISIIMFDIDHFKKINDGFGHDIGDFVLIEFVKLIKQTFRRESDFIARVGGEEFAVILPDFTAEAASKKAKELMEKVRSEVFVQDHREIRFTISMGISQLGPSETVQSWVKRADEALYHSKNTGRNRFTVANPPAHLKVAS